MHVSEGKKIIYFLAEREGHAWVKKLDLSHVDFGSGMHVIGKGGKLNVKYNLSLPVTAIEEDDSIHDALPFEPIIPNDKTIKAMRAARRGKLTSVSNVNKLLESLNDDEND